MIQYCREVFSLKIATRLLELSGRDKKHFYIYELRGKAGEPIINAHWHDDLEILYAVCDGVVGFDTKTVEFKRDSFVFVNKQQLHPVTAYSDGKIFAMVFDLKFLDFKNNDFCQQEIMCTLNNKTFLFPQFADLDKNLHNEITVILQNTIQLYYSNIPGYELKIKCNLYEIIFLLYSNGKFVTSNEENHNYEKLSYVKDTMAFMENNYAETITVDDLSRNVHISKYHLIKTFKEITGDTPMIYLRNLRIDMSKDILAEGFSVTDAAFMSGFNNVSYYIRHFKAINNISPKEYQKRNRKNSKNLF
jgi:AraC-like DNA-binding protein